MGSICSSVPLHQNWMIYLHVLHIFAHTEDVTGSYCTFLLVLHILTHIACSLERMLTKIETFPAICYFSTLCSDKQFVVKYVFLVSYPNNFYKKFVIPQHIFKKWFHTPTKFLQPQSVTFLMTAPLSYDLICRTTSL